MKYYVCIDIGGTFLKHGLADGEGNLLEKGILPTEIREKGVSGLLEKMQGIVENYGTNCKISGIALASPGIVDAERGDIVFAGSNFPGYTGTRLKWEMETRCHLPCEVENDVNAAGLGELWLGAGKGAASLVCVAVGTGIGGCVILDGKLLRGSANCAGEIGFLAMGDGRTLEESCSTAGLVRNVAAFRGVGPETLDGERIFADAREGRQDAVQAIDAMVEGLAMGLSNICCLLNPQRILLSGGIMAQEAYLRPRLEEALRRKLVIAPLRETTELVFARLGNDAGMIGALYHFLRGGTSARV